jgi:hypothetical protein
VTERQKNEKHTMFEAQVEFKGKKEKKEKDNEKDI